MNWTNRQHNAAFSLAKRKAKQKEFSWLLVILCLLFTGYDWYFNQSLNQVSLYVSLALLLLGFIIPVIFFPFLYAWMWVGLILSEISSTIILAIIFFVGISLIRMFKRSKSNEGGWEEISEQNNFEEQY